jgi:hypothetical protein
MASKIAAISKKRPELPYYSTNSDEFCIEPYVVGVFFGGGGTSLK